MNWNFLFIFGFFALGCQSAHKPILGYAGYSWKPVWPVKGTITSHFGRRGWGSHHGIDIAASKGTSIHPTAPGRVTFAGWQSGYGKTVIVQHRNGIQSLYAHCWKVFVKKGEHVRPNQTIAAVGSTGNASGNHLHFEMRDLKQRPFDPVSFLPNYKIAKKTKKLF